MLEWIEGTLVPFVKTVSFIDFLGYCAAFCSVTSFIPQARKIFRTRLTRDVSLGTYVVFATGAFLWIIYGVLKEVWPVVFSCSVSFTLATFILAMKLILERKGPPEKDNDSAEKNAVGKKGPVAA